MTSETLTPHRHHPGAVKSAALGVTGVGIAIGAVFGITSLVSTDGAPTAPGPDQSRVVNTDGARDSWEGRIGPDAKPGTEHGVRDSWMPAGTTDRDLRNR